jgi:hypothetical protein
MACDITLGRAEPCKQFVGGVKNLYFINFDSTDEITKDVDGLITTIELVGGTTKVNAYKYEVRYGSDLTTNIQSSRENGTTLFEQVVNATFKGLNQEQNQELKLLAWGRPRIIVEDNNSNLWLVGEEHGADLTGGTLVTGNAMTDLYGATVTFTANEKDVPTQVVALTAVTVVNPT